MAQRLIDVVQKTAGYLADHGIEQARRESEWLIGETLGLSRMDLYTRFDMPLEETELAPLRERVLRRARREPLAYVLGCQPFRTLTLVVGPGVLVPRPETEELLERVFAEADAAAPLRVLDVGTGSGAIALACKAERPAWEVHASDCSAAALATARHNAAGLDLAITFHECHLATGLPGGWDLVIANLPYVAEEERDLCDPELAFEPAEALFAADHGLALIAELIADANRLLTDEGTLWLEHGWQQGAAITDLATTQGFDCRIIPDSGGRDRIARISRHG